MARSFAAAFWILTGSALLVGCSSYSPQQVRPSTSTTTAWPSSPDPSTPPAPTSERSSASTIESSPEPTLEQRATLPNELVGTWQTFDQGSAEEVLRIHPDGTYERAEVLMQQRSSGVFQFSIGTAGFVEVEAGTMTLTPERGVGSMTDPDSPSSNYENRPITDLKLERFEWAMDGDLLVLTGEYGRVPYERSQ